MAHAADPRPSASPQDADAPGAVLPRRPGRNRPATAAAAPEWRARPETGGNLFLGIFDTATSDTDRHARPRQRISAAIAAREAASAPELLNLWHDAFAEAPPPQDGPATEGAPAAEPTELDRLRALRSALYAADDAPALPPPASVPMRLAVHAMHGTLIAASAPVGVAVMTYSLLRGEDMRLTARAMAACGAVLAFLDHGMIFV